MKNIISIPYINTYTRRVISSQTQRWLHKLRFLVIKDDEMTHTHTHRDKVYHIHSHFEAFRWLWIIHEHQDFPMAATIWRSLLD